MAALPNIYQYDDYRQFLSDWIEAKKKSRGFSLRSFAKHAGFKAHNIVQLVVAGQRNLTLRSIGMFATGLGLSPDQSRYFEDLVRMNQASSAREKMRLYEAVLTHPGRRRAAPAELPQMSFFQHWLAPVIFEMIQFPDFKPDAAWIAAQFKDETVGVSEVRAALKTLLDSGLVVKKKNGSWAPAATHVHTGDHVKDLQFLNYHEQALVKAVDALYKVPSTERHFHVLTTAVPASAYGEIKDLAERFEAELWRIVEKSADKNEVMQISLQIIPLLRSPK